MESMDKRTVIAVVLALFVLIGYQYLIPPAQQQPEPQKQTETKTEQAKKEIPSPAPLPIAGTLAADTAPGKILRVETPLYVASISSKGGTVSEFTLKAYSDKDGKAVALLKNAGHYPPLALGANDNFDLAKVNFVVTGNNLTLKDTQTGNITFEYSSPQFSVRRTFTFYADKYKFDLKDEVSGLQDYWLALGNNFGIYDAKDTSAQHIGPVILKDTDRTELSANDLSAPQTFSKGIKWVAQEDKYFFSSIVPSGEVVEARAWKVQDSPVVALKMKSGVNNVMIYAGPKDYDILQELHIGLEHIIDFGFFSILSRPLFWILKFFYKFMGNYGWAIVLLTIVVRVPFIPLLNKSQRSMKKMQDIQPKIAELKEKYKKDPQKLQKETLEIYKKYKVNPVGGCLPMLLQIPVFFALYKVLMIAIELRRAPFISWIKDLSEPDTLFGHIPSWFPLLGDFAIGPLPIVMGATMVIQQKMTPTTMDPSQNRIMMLMPVIFTFMFLNFASGLVLYWLVNNILSIIQQFHTNKKLAAEAKN
ncbi:MAG TPA: membrane protein insertase YidC [Thermodesulfovibrionales bacterium]|nr:membrane protein insertase YidC [Thermodesulfovibrionales bacterium]